MSGTLLLARLALRRDRGHLLIWTAGLLVFATVCALHVSTGFGEEAERVASLRIAADSRILLVGRGLPLGASHGAFLFYTYGVLLANALALFAVLFAVRHGRAEEDDGTRELLRASMTGRLAGLAATFASGAVAIAALTLAMVAGLVIGGAEAAGSLRAGMVCALVGLAFLPIGAVCGQIGPSARAAVGAGFALVLLGYTVRAWADILADIDPGTLVGAPAPLAWFSPFSLAGMADPYGAVDPRPLLVLAAGAAIGATVAMLVERRREFGASAVPARPGPAHGPASLRTPFRLALRLQRGTLLAMMLAGAVIGGFAAVMASLAISDADNAAIAETIRSIIGGEGPLYDLLLSYVMVLVGECAAIAGALVILRARREEITGNVELARGTATGPGRWFGSVLAVGCLSILLVLATAGLGAALVYLALGMDPGITWSVLAATAAQVPAAGLYLGVVALAFAALPRLVGGIAWTILTVGVVLAEIGGRLGLPDWAIGISPFLHTPVVTAVNSEWTGAIWMTVAAVAAAGLAVTVYRRRDLSP